MSKIDSVILIKENSMSCTCHMQPGNSFKLCDNIDCCIVRNSDLIYRITDTRHDYKHLEGNYTFFNFERALQEEQLRENNVEHGLVAGQLQWNCSYCHSSNPGALTTCQKCYEDYTRRPLRYNEYDGTIYWYDRESQCRDIVAKFSIV